MEIFTKNKERQKPINSIIDNYIFRIENIIKKEKLNNFVKNSRNKCNLLKNKKKMKTKFNTKKNKNLIL
jgi:hypothetical protein